MPQYEYQCRLCRHGFEAFQRMADAPLRKCPECGRESLDRIIGAPAIRTATTFVSGKGTLLDQFGGDEAEVKRVVDAAKRQGYSPRETDIYEPCLASCKGDPAAFIQSSDPVGGLQRACAKLGTGCEGRGITIKPPSLRSDRRKRQGVKS